MNKAVGIIPARWGSTRFPGKPLHPIAGKALLRRVWERCEASEKSRLGNHCHRRYAHRRGCF